MSLSLSAEETRCRDGEEVHLVEVRDDDRELLCRLFVQPTDSGCQVQVDAAEDGSTVRVFETESCVLVGVGRDGR